jgi:hypothetical protein
VRALNVSDGFIETQPDVRVVENINEDVKGCRLEKGIITSILESRTVPIRPQYREDLQRNSMNKIVTTKVGEWYFSKNKYT